MRTSVFAVTTIWTMNVLFMMLSILPSSFGSVAHYTPTMHRYPSNLMVVRGRLTLYMEDHFDTNTHFKLGEIQDEAGDRHVFTVTDDVKHLRTDDEVEIALKVEPMFNAASGFLFGHNTSRGMRPTGRGISASSRRGLRAVAAELVYRRKSYGLRTRRDAVDERSVLVVTVILPETNRIPYCDNDCIADSWWRGRQNVDNVFRASSYGKVQFPQRLFRHEVVEVAGRAETFVDCDADDNIYSMVQANLSQRLGSNWESMYDHVVQYLPYEIPGCDWAGLASVGGGSIWMRSSSSATAAHEVAHNLGLNHGSSDYDDDNVQDAEYGDTTDVCGGGSTYSEMNAPHRLQLGYVPPSAILSIPSRSFLQSCSNYTASGTWQWPWEEYLGEQAVTVYGRTCQRWDSQSPHSHGYEDTGNHNYCRDPDGTGFLWCYTTDSNHRWEQCEANCSAEVPTIVNRSALCATEYNVNLTALTEEPDTSGSRPSAIKIARQKGGVYVISFRTNAGLYDAALAPEGKSDAVYVHYQNGATANTHLVDWLKPGEEWRESGSGWRLRVFGISCPLKESVQVVLDFCPDSWMPMDDHCTGASGAHHQGYRGAVSTTSCGTTCQPWNETSYEADVSTGIGNHSACRNPDGKDGTWCYTDFDNGEWDYCTVCNVNSLGKCKTRDPIEPSCTCDSSTLLSGVDYRGDERTTVTGRTCQRWDSQTPNEHSYLPESYPEAGLESNFCRNPDGEPMLWCYTTTGGRWDFCDPCDASTRSPTQSSAPTASSSPVQSPTRIPTTSAPSCALNPADGSEYRGYANTSVNGYTCQAWSSQAPNEHSYTTQRYPDGGLDSNYCRNPGGEDDGLWCYTVDGPRWDYCGCPLDVGHRSPTIAPAPTAPVPSVAPTISLAPTASWPTSSPTNESSCWKITNSQAYRGNMAETISGITCQDWSAQTPHSHSIGGSLNHNFCRDPDGSGIIWCYTTDPNVRWERCHDSDEQPIEWFNFVQPIAGDVVRRIAVTSCFHYDSDAEVALHHLIGQNFDLLLELGDNVYSDTSDVCAQRQTYAAKRGIPTYRELVAPTNGTGIPVLATWDDHDYCWNNQGSGCPSWFKIESQRNFLTHYGIAREDVRWQSPLEGGQEGIYSSTVFGSAEQRNRIHVVMLDARFHRSPTYSAYGTCEGASSTMLGETQWTWLEAQLNITQSEVLVIGSGIQVLPPLAATSGSSSVSKNSYCAFDGENGTFDMARRSLGELGVSESDWCPSTSVVGGHYGCTARGTDYESWAEIPAERARLLRLVQNSIRRNKTKVAVFASGDQHWAEISSKRLRESSEGLADDCMVYEVTGSGLAANWVRSAPFFNDNRHPSTRCDHQGDAQYVHQCVFPFSFEGKIYRSCTMADSNTPWCAHEVNGDSVVVEGQWGQCASFANHAPSNYAEIEVDFTSRLVNLQIWLPGTTETRVDGRAALAEQVVVPFESTFSPTLAPAPTVPHPTHQPTWTCPLDPIDGSAYRGQANTTINGYTCQHWDAQHPNEHSRTPHDYPSAGLEGNFCRNPDGEDGLWCYTLDGPRYDFCGCPPDLVTPPTYAPTRAPGDENREIEFCQRYRGRRNLVWQGTHPNC